MLLVTYNDDASIKVRHCKQRRAYKIHFYYEPADSIYEREKKLVPVLFSL